ncbi:MAG: hypothetical protein Q9159_004231 [Coniocarpon cinnabarinum]
MSCRVDNYLNLCLTEAAQSPLRYRHGAIIVRGGKVIGRGHNAYRSGFDGGALQHGSYGMTEFRPVHAKSKLKSKRKSSPSMSPSHCPSSGTNAFFRPFEATSGGGHLANTPLSMHSEMMAIQDALSATTATSSVSAEPRWATRRARHRARSGDLKAVHLDAARMYEGYPNGNDNANEKNNRNVGKVNAVNADAKESNSALATSLEMRLELDQVKASKPALHHHSHHCHVHHHEDRQEAQQHRQQNRHPKPHSLQHHRQQQQQHKHSRPSESQRILHAQPARLKPSPNPKAIPDSMGLPTLKLVAQVTHASHRVRDRQRNPRLHGADLYVARLCVDNSADQPQGRSVALSHATMPSPLATSSSLPASNSLNNNRSTDSETPRTPRSLHDELTCTSASSATPSASSCETQRSNSIRHKAHASRPCYRCISYMHAMGIKRVFWTTQDGQWQGEKVARLMEVLEGNGNASGTRGADEDVEIGEMYATKHEVLMMRRMMGKAQGR